MAVTQSERLDRPAVAVERLADRIAASRWASAAVIILVALGCFLPGFTTIPPIDREEAQFAEAARQMVASGTYADIERLTDGNRPEPIAMYWLEAASAWIAGEGHDTPIWIYRLPALIGAIGAALATWWMALVFGRPRAALLAGLFIAANIVLAGEARLARPDAMLLAAIVLAEGALARLWLKESDKPSVPLAVLFWLAIGFGILLKGPIAPLVLGLTVAVLAYQRRSAEWLRRLQPQWGIPLLLLVILPWIVAIASVEATSPEDAARAEMLLRIGGEVDPRAPPGSYALLFAAIFFPGASFFALGVPWLLQHVRHPAIFFGIAWAAPFWFVTEFFPNKLPHFMLPAFPAVALLAGIAVDKGAARVSGWISWFFSLGPLVWPVVVAIGVPMALYVMENTIPDAALIFLAAGVVIGVIAWHWLRRGRAVAAAAVSVLSAIVIYFGQFAFVVPAFDRIHLSKKLLFLGQQAVTCPEPDIISAGFVEPGLLLMSDRKIAFSDGDTAANFLNERACRVAFVEERQLASFRQRAEDLGLELADRGGTFGYNLGNGRWVRLRLFTAAEPNQ